MPACVYNYDAVRRHDYCIRSYCLHLCRHYGACRAVINGSESMNMLKAWFLVQLAELFI